MEDLDPDLIHDRLLSADMIVVMCIIQLVACV